MRLRLDPATGRLAQRIAADGAAPWAVVENDGSVTSLTDGDVAEWQSVVLAPRPAPTMLFAVACPACDAHGPLTDPHDRERLVDEHEDHGGARYVASIRHPSRAPDRRPPAFAPGAKVTFHGSTTGAVAGLVSAMVIEAAELPDEDGVPVAGYVVDVNGAALFVPGTALAKG